MSARKEQVAEGLLKIEREKHILALMPHPYADQTLKAEYFSLLQRKALATLRSSSYMSSRQPKANQAVTPSEFVPTQNSTSACIISQRMECAITSNRSAAGTHVCPNESTINLTNDSSSLLGTSNIQHNQGYESSVDSRFYLFTGKMPEIETRDSHTLSISQISDAPDRQKSKNSACTECMHLGN